MPRPARLRCRGCPRGTSRRGSPAAPAWRRSPMCNSPPASAPSCGGRTTHPLLWSPRMPPRPARGAVPPAARRDGDWPGYGSQGDPLLPDAYLTVAVLLVVREGPSAAHVEDQREQILSEPVHGGGTVEQQTRVEVDPVRLLDRDLAIGRDLERGHGETERRAASGREEQQGSPARDERRR